jgi:glycosyltransferase involved in cell wall biosynthesis
MSEVETITRILAIGPLPPPIGGTRVLFRLLVDALAQRSDVQVRVIPLPPVRSNKMRAAWHFLGQIFDLLRFVPRSDVITLHSGASAIPSRVAVVSAVAKLFRKPLVVRTFGGDQLRVPSDSNGPGRVVRALRKADLYLGETQELVEEARQEGVKRVEWFPNSRPMPPLDQGHLESDRPCRKFVFLGHVKKTKGIHELIEAGEHFGDDVQVDVYGPYREGMTEEVFDGCRRVRYRGVVEPDHVLEVLRGYDAMILPTYHPGEGYPGIIIEAYAVGLPVICTRWRRLPELVDERSGILIEPKDGDALYQAMRHLMDVPDHYARLRRGVIEKREEFDAAVWNDRFVQFCNEVIKNHRASKSKTG